MNIVYLIGNGFDIACGLDTSAKSIISQYRDELERNIDSWKTQGNIDIKPYEIFLDSISNDFDSWADFEMQLGRITAEFDSEEYPANQFEIAFVHFREFLIEHLIAQQTKIEECDINQNIVKSFASKLVRFFNSKLRKNQKGVLQEFLNKHKTENWNIDFIVFNYTYFIDQLIESITNPIETHRISYATYARSVNSLIHIHGSLADEYGIIVGVDNQDQIKSEILKMHSHITDSLIKPNVNEGMGELRDSTAGDLIDYADIILIHGMSIGESDKQWWLRIGNWLSSNVSDRLLILSVFLPSFDYECRLRAELYKRVVGEMQERFLEAASVSYDEWELCKQRILVTINANDFNEALEPIIHTLNSNISSENNISEKNNVE